MSGLARQIMGAGFSAGQAQALGGSGSTGLTSLGSSITDALQLTTANNIISSAASSTGVKLPAGSPGDQIIIYNGGGQTVAVYPPNTTSTINSGSAGAGFNVANTKSAVFKYVTGSAVIALLSA